jgi:hypothetical protein
MSKITQTGSSSATYRSSTPASVEDPTGQVKLLNVEQFEASSAYAQFLADQSNLAATQFPAARWLDVVLRRLAVSIGVAGEPADGTWLERNIVEKASNVFRITSDLLPSEPHLSSSRQGSLVAEFPSSHGSLSMVVSASSVLLYAAHGGREYTRSLSFSDLNPERLRDVVAGLAQEAGVSQHGKVEAR